LLRRATAAWRYPNISIYVLYKKKTTFASFFPKRPVPK